MKMKQIYLLVPFLVIILAINFVSATEASQYRHYTYGVDFNLEEFVVGVNGTLDTDFSSSCWVTIRKDSTNALLFNNTSMLQDYSFPGNYYLTIPASNTGTWSKGNYTSIMSCSDNNLWGSENLSFTLSTDVSTTISDTNDYLSQLIRDTNAIGRGLTGDQNAILYATYNLTKDTNAFLQTLNTTINSINSTINSIDNKVDTANSALIDLNSRAVSTQSDVLYIKNNMATIQSITDMNTSIQSILQYSTNIQSIVTDSNSKVYLISDALNQTNSSLITINSALTDINNTLSLCSYSPAQSVCGRLADLSTRLNTLETLTSTISTKVTDVNTSLTNARSEIATVNSTTNEILLVANDANLNTAYVRGIIDSINSNTSQNNTLTQEAIDLLTCTTAPASSVCDKLSLLQTQITDINSGTISSLSQLSSTAQSNLQLSQTISADVSSILLDLNCDVNAPNEICTKLDQLQASVANNQTALLDLNSRTVTMSNNLDQTQTNTTSALTNLSDMNSRIVQASNTISSTASDVTYVRGRTDTIQSTLVDVNSYVTAIRQTTTSTNTIVSDINSLVASNALAISDINDQVALVKDITLDINSKVNSVQAVIEDINDTVNNIRVTQNNKFTVVLSDLGVISPGTTFRAKVWIFDANGAPVNASTLPKITLYDPSRNVIVTNADMTLLETGIYTYNFVISSSQTAGEWEAVATVIVNEVTVKPSDFWELTGSPPEIKIISLIDKTVPTITADINITNEGFVSQEYQYEYCIVINQSNQCGGPDDVDYQSGAKLINPGETWNTQLTLNVSTPDVYWFKVKVYYGIQSSATSKQFVAEGSGASPTSGGSGGGGGGGSGFFGLPIIGAGDGKINIDNYSDEIILIPGEPTFSSIKISNTGTADMHNVTATIEGIPSEWYTVELGKVTLVPEDNTSIILKIIAPKETLSKDLLAKIKVTADEGQNVEVDTVIRIMESPLKEVLFTNIETQRSYVGENSSVTISLTNSEPKDLNLVISLLAPLDWELLENDIKVHLEPGQTKTITFNFHTSDRSGVQSLVAIIKKSDGSIFQSVGEDRLLKSFLVAVRKHNDDTFATGNLALISNTPSAPFESIFILIILGLTFTIIYIERSHIKQFVSNLSTPSNKELLLSRIDYRLSRIEERLNSSENNPLQRRADITQKKYGSSQRESLIRAKAPRWGSNKFVESNSETTLSKPKTPIFGRKGNGGSGFYFE